MRIFLAILLATQQVFALTTNNKVAAFNRTEGAVVYENYALNQSFDKNLNGVTAFGGTPSIVTTTGVKLIGAGSLQWATAANTDILQIRSKPLPIGTNGLNCQSSFIYATPSGGVVTTQEFTAYVANSSGTNISGTTNLPATFNIAGTQTSKTVTLYYPCPYNAGTPANSYVDVVVKHTASNSTSIIIDEMMIQQANSLGAGVPNNTYSAVVAGTASPSTVSAVTPSGSAWITSCTRSATGRWACPISGFNLKPNCNLTKVTASGSTGPWIPQYDYAGSTNTSLVFFANDSTNTAVNTNFIVNCQRAEADFIQPAITPNQWNYGPTAYTPTFGAGFGTPTNVSLFHWRTGKFLNVSGAFTSGTTSAAIGSISLPNGLTIDASALGINNTTSNPGQEVGRFNYPAVDGFGNIVTAPATSTSVVYFATNNGNGTRLTPTSSVSSNALTSTTVTSIFFRVPIAGWTENQNAPQLLGSSTTNFNGAHREVFGSFYGANNTSTCSSGTCTMFNSTGDVVATRTATGNYDLTITPPFNSVPSCTCSRSSLSGSAIECGQNLAGSTASVAKISTQAGSTYTDAQVNFRCWAPR